MVKLLLRGKEYEVRSGMNLLDAIKKIGIMPTGVLGIREGELITEDEILKDGDVIHLVSAISGG